MHVGMLNIVKPRRAVVIIGLLAASATGGGYIVAAPQGLAAASAALAKAVADPLALLNGRSPGARSPGALTQTKARYAHDGDGAHRRGTRPGEQPVERVLSALRERPSFIDAENLPFVDLASLAPTGSPVPPAATPPINLPGVAPSITPPVILAPLPGGGNGGGTGTPVAAVPELATWAMLIIGFLGIGAALRRGKTPRHALPF